MRLIRPILLLSALQLFSLSVFAQPAPPAAGSLTVNTTTGAITAPVTATTFASANSLVPTSAVAITAGKLFSVTGTLTLSGTDSSTLNIGTGGTLGTAAYTAGTAYDPAGAAAAITPTTLGLVIGTNTQAHSTRLDSIAGLSDSVGWLHNNGSGTFAYSTPTYGDVGAAPAFTSGTANYFWATPNGTTGAPSLRAIVAADIPALSYEASGSISTHNGLATAHGFTTAGKAIANLANPGAITFLRINADNSASALSAADTRTALGLGTAGSPSFAALTATTGSFTATATGQGVNLHGGGTITGASGAVTIISYTGATITITPGSGSQTIFNGIVNFASINAIHQIAGHNAFQGDAGNLYLYGGSTGGQIRKTDNSAAIFTWTDAGIFNFVGTLSIASTSAVTGVRTATAALDFAEIAAGATADLTITVTGAAINDVVQLGLPAAPTAGIEWEKFVSATNTVTVRARNYTASPVDPASATYRVTVTSF